jgi:hypothetical protein
MNVFQEWTRVVEQMGKYFRMVFLPRRLCEYMSNRSHAELAQPPPLELTTIHTHFHKKKTSYHQNHQDELRSIKTISPHPANHTLLTHK